MDIVSIIILSIVQLEFLYLILLDCYYCLQNIIIAGESNIVLSRHAPQRKVCSFVLDGQTVFQRLSGLIGGCIAC